MWNPNGASDCYVVLEKRDLQRGRSGGLTARLLSADAFAGLVSL